MGVAGAQKKGPVAYGFLRMCHEATQNLALSFCGKKSALLFDGQQVASSLELRECMGSHQEHILWQIHLHMDIRDFFFLCARIGGKGSPATRFLCAHVLNFCSL